MDEEWGTWTFSVENETEINEITSKLCSENSDSIWWNLFNHSFQKGGNQIKETDENMQEEPNLKETEIIDLIKQSIKMKSDLNETIFKGISYNSFYNIFQALTSDLNDNKFSNFCDLISTWTNSFIIEQALKAVVLFKLQENNASACTIYTVKELAKKLPSQLCHAVLIPLVTDKSYQCNDVELLSSILICLPDPQKDLLIESLTEREELTEKHWLLFQALTKSLPPQSIINLINCISKWSSTFSKSQIFGRFLVSFCKCLDFTGNKALLIEAVAKHDTLLKQQALKYLESI